MILKLHNLVLEVIKNFLAMLLHIRECENAINKDNFILEELIDRGYQEDY